MKLIFSYSLFILLFAGCDPVSGQQDISREQLARQFGEIEVFIATAKCSSKDQCKFIPYGSKACGGPQGYLIFSSDIDVEKLKLMVQKYTEAEKRYNKENGIMSDCSIPPEPRELKCENGNCIRVD